MTALSQYYDRVRKENPGLDLAFDDGQSVNLKPVALLSDDETRMLRRSIRNLAAFDQADDAGEEVDPTQVRDELVSLLAGVSTDRVLTANELSKCPLGVLMAIFQDWTGAGSEDATKSSSGAQPGDEAREPSDG